MKSAFEFTSYTRYLKAFFAAETATRGLKARFAESVQCQGSFVSQVLNGRADLSAEQAFRASRFLGHSTEESDYFQLMVLRARAADPDYRDLLDRKMEQARAKQTDLKSRIPTNAAVSIEAQSEYYSTWAYAAVHVAASVPRLNTAAAIAGALGLPLEVVQKLLSFLAAQNFVQLSGGEVSMGPTHIHLPAHSVLVKTHHANWRSKAIQSLDHVKKTDQHYSVVYSLSYADAARIKTRISDFVQQNMEIVGPSKEEALFAHAIDFFEL